MGVMSMSPGAATVVSKVIHCGEGGSGSDEYATRGCNCGE